MKKNILSFIALLIISGYSLAQDVIYKTDGAKIEVKVSEITKDLIKYYNYSQSRPLRNIDKSEVFMIIYEDNTREVFKKKELPQGNDQSQIIEPAVIEDTPEVIAPSSRCFTFVDGLESNSFCSMHYKDRIWYKTLDKAIPIDISIQDIYYAKLYLEKALLNSNFCSVIPTSNNSSVDVVIKRSTYIASIYDNPSITYCRSEFEIEILIGDSDSVKKSSYVGKSESFVGSRNATDGYRRVKTKEAIDNLIKEMELSIPK